MPMLTAYALLAAAILAELTGTTFLQKSEQFTRLVPTLIMAAAFGLSLFLLSHALKVIPLGVAYAMWGGLGIVLVALVSRFVFGQHLDAAAMLGIALIVSGVVVLNLFSSSATH